VFKENFCFLQIIAFMVTSVIAAVLAFYRFGTDLVSLNAIYHHPEVSVCYCYTYINQK